jgi:hypothetical protein
LQSLNLNLGSPVGIAKTSIKHCFLGCPLTQKKERNIYINDDNTVEAPFKKGTSICNVRSKYEGF